MAPSAGPAPVSTPGSAQAPLVGAMAPPAQDPPVHPALQKHVRTTKEKVGPPVDASLAKHITDAFDRANLDPNSLKLTDIYTRNMRPDNLPVLAKTEINQEVSAGLPFQVLKRDGLARSAQHATVRSASGITTVLHQLMQVHTIFQRLDMPADVRAQYAELPQQLVDILIDAVTCLGYAGNRINTLRRNMIRPHIQYQFRFLCDRALACYESLLGLDLETVVKQTSDQRKTSSQIVMRPRNRNSQRGRGRGGCKQSQGRNQQQPFLGELLSHVIIDDYAVHDFSNYRNSQGPQGHDELCECKHCVPLFSHTNVPSLGLDLDQNTRENDSGDFVGFNTPDETLFVRNSTSLASYSSDVPFCHKLNVKKEGGGACGSGRQ